MRSMRMRLVSSVSCVASYVRRISHRFLYGVFADSRLTCIRLSALCGGGGGEGGGGGVRTSMRMRLVSSVSSVAT